VYRTRPDNDQQAVFFASQHPLDRLAGFNNRFVDASVPAFRLLIARAGSGNGFQNV
jgi:hypothetical protein